MEKWGKRVNRTCVGVVLLALLLRMGGSSLVTASQDHRSQLASFFLYLQTGLIASPDEAQEHPETTPQGEEVLAALSKTTTPQVPTKVFDFPTWTPEEHALLSFPSELAQSIEVKLCGEYQPDLPALMEKPVELDFSGTEPRILILHTHASESYTQSPGWEYTSSSPYRCLDEERSVVNVGNLVAQRLEEAGIPVIHDKTFHDQPSYNHSYSRAMETISYWMEQYPSIQMVIDVHRDAVELENHEQYATSAIVNGTQSAQVMLVIGSDEGGLYHPTWEKNLSWALKLQAQMDRQFPGLARPLLFYPQRYNQHAAPGSIVLEVGTTGDTMEKALTAADAFCQVLIQVIDGLNLRS